MDFCKGLLSFCYEVGLRLIEPDIFAPTDPDMHTAVGARLAPELLSPNAPILSEKEIAEVVDCNDEEATLVVHRVNARKAVDNLCRGADDLEVDNVNGYIANLEHGSLGLIKA